MRCLTRCRLSIRLYRRAHHCQCAPTSPDHDGIGEEDEGLEQADGEEADDEAVGEAECRGEQLGRRLLLAEGPRLERRVPAGEGPQEAGASLERVGQMPAQGLLMVSVPL